MTDKRSSATNAPSKSLREKFIDSFILTCAGPAFSREEVRREAEHIVAGHSVYASETVSETGTNDRCEKCPVIGCIYPRCGMDGQEVAEQLLVKYALDLLAITNAAAFKIPLPNSNLFVMVGTEADVKALPSARGTPNVYWLIEHEVHKPRRYWTFDNSRTGDGVSPMVWETDPTKAMRYKTREDAMRTVMMLDEKCGAYDHMDCTGPVPTDTPSATFTKEWIPVGTSDVPVEEQTVLVFSDFDRCAFTAYAQDGRWLHAAGDGTEKYRIRSVTHWMPLPELPSSYVHGSQQVKP